MVNPNPSYGKITSGKKRKSNINLVSTNKKSMLYIPSFLLTFKIFNMNLHNCLVDSSASSNVVPFYMCKKLNATPTKCDTHITQLDRTEVKLISEMKDDMIPITSNLKFHQFFDIIVIDIPESYGMLLNQD